MRGSLRIASPAGVVPVLVAALLAGGCEPDVAPPFEVEGTGGLEGLAFFDEDRDGAFEPTQGDVALPGVDVVVFERGTRSAYSGATATTDAAGRFTITGLPAGTHDLWIDTTTVPAAVAFCQNPQPATVYLGELSYEPVQGRNGCVITIAEAEALDPAAGEFVTVSGIVTSFPGQIDNGFTQIEDETGGIRVFDFNALPTADPPIEIGDRIEVSGTLSEFGDELQISGTVSLNDFAQDVAPVVPTEATTAEITEAGADPAADLQGRLVVVRGAEITGAFGDPGNSQNAFIDDGSGVAVLRVDDGVANRDDLNTLFPVGTCYDITGVVGSFNGTGQIFPRSTDDMAVVECN